MVYHSILRLALKDGEFWYGGCVSDGINMPYGSKKNFKQSLIVNNTSNQAVPLLLSNHGRYVWCEKGFEFSFEEGILTVCSPGAEIVFLEGFHDLKGALLHATHNHFHLSERVPPAPLFTAPQYNTWIELLYNQNQKQITDYAKKIIETGLPAGVLIIDCGWAEYLGCFEFHSGKFPDPRGMVDLLHELGFKVMLWESPFVTADTVIFRELASKGYLIRNRSGEPAIKHWWDGYSAVLDMTNPDTCKWLREQNQRLIDLYGVDGFKLDGGDARYYSEDDVTYLPVTPNEHCELWARFGLNYEYNEYRACYRCSGEPLVQRLADKCHSWAEDGLASLIPNMLAQGVMGYPFGCPDMIGGGEYMNFMMNSEKLDQELVVRYAQCSSLMPMMQFSAAPWRILSAGNFEICKEAALIHARFGNLIYKLAKEYCETGEPIIRYLEYCYPHQGYAEVTDQFMLGDSVLVAPVLEKGAVSRKVVFPPGVWHDQAGNSIQGPCVKEIESGLNSLPYFINENNRLEGLL